jgi:hypothetical protein
MPRSAAWLLATLALALVLSACVSPQGAPIEECGPDFQADVTETPATITGPARTISIQCYRVIAERRLEIGFVMPPGPECFAVDHVDVIEDAESLSLELRIGPIRNPLGGACPEVEFVWATPVELNRLYDGRQVLDASRLGE